MSDTQRERNDEYSPATTVVEVTELEQLATEFSARIRRGDVVTIERYAAEYPHLADGIRELFPVVQTMERHKRDRDAGPWKRFGLEIKRPERLGDCRLIREIGRGGMGIVFEGRREPDNERVAVKWLPWSSSKQSVEKARFEKEAKTIGRLQHPHIVPMLGFGEDDKHSYFVMPFIEGVGLDVLIARLNEHESLRFDREVARIHGDPLAASLAASTNDPVEAHDDSSQVTRGLKRTSWKLFARIAIQVARGLSHAHRQGVLHNDVKPGNLLLDSSGRVWVTDFGVAQPLDLPEGEFREVAGTLRYMAPERLSGFFDELSDLYSLGLTLYELVTRRAAFEAADRKSLIDRIRNTSPTLPRRIDRRIPRALEIIILRAIRPDPDERYYSVEAFEADLQRFVNDERIKAKRPTRWRLVWERLRRKWRRV